MRTILITGARGLVGSHLVPLLAKDSKVYALDRKAPKRPGATPILADLSRPLDPAILPPRLDAVVHLAQSSRFRDFPDAALDIHQVNVGALAVLLDHARKVGAGHFILASTGGVYARSGAPLTETSPLLPDSRLGYYAASKRAGELLAQAYAPSMTVAALRYFFIYGPGQKGQMLVPRLIESVRTGRSVTLDGPDGMRFNPIHAADAAAATAAALELKESATINVAGPESLSLRDLAVAIGAALHVAPKFEETGHPGGGDLIADTSLMRSSLCAPTRTMSGALAELL